MAVTLSALAGSVTTPTKLPPSGPRHSQEFGIAMTGNARIMKTAVRVIQWHTTSILIEVFLMVIALQNSARINQESLS